MNNLNIEDLTVGKKVYWKDPDDNLTSGFYQIAVTNRDTILAFLKEDGCTEEEFPEYYEDIYILLANEQSEVEVFFRELYEA